MGSSYVHIWTQPNGYGSPALYARLYQRRREVLKNVLKLCTRKDMKILEMGCNSGRDLEILWRAGYTALSGVEVNPEAVAELKTARGGLYASMEMLYERPIERVLPVMSDNQFDLLYTFTVLQHLPPESEGVFRHMARIAKRLLIIENETFAPPRDYLWLRNYGDIFKELGYKEMYSEVLHITEDLPGDYTLRALRKVRNV